ncbi:MAG: fumarate hydratase C-terminal domain-containing protein [Candidatus Omnitrophica bacterium]|nr:fumarate hydratase C-terminal domain-containing protein [Candidatus Omnitrophota bacterium]
MKSIKGQFSKALRAGLRMGQEILYTGTIYTARDQAHKRLAELIKKKKRLPIDLKDAIIYYCGPTPSKFKNKLGSAGPTTSLRMDKFTPLLLRHGVGAFIGKGNRSKEVVKAIKKHSALYFIAVGGAGAYLSRRIKKAKAIAFTDLGPEAIYRLEVREFPLTVAIDVRGKNIYGGDK